MLQIQPLSPERPAEGGFSQLTLEKITSSLSDPSFPKNDTELIATIQEVAPRLLMLFTDGTSSEETLFSIEKEVYQLYSRCHAMNRENVVWDALKPICKELSFVIYCGDPAVPMTLPVNQQVRLSAYSDYFRTLFERKFNQKKIAFLDGIASREYQLVIDLWGKEGVVNHQRTTLKDIALLAEFFLLNPTPALFKEIETLCSPRQERINKALLSTLCTVNHWIGTTSSEKTQKLLSYRLLTLCRKEKNTLQGTKKSIVESFECYSHLPTKLSEKDSSFLHLLKRQKGGIALMPTLEVALRSSTKRTTQVIMPYITKIRSLTLLCQISEKFLTTAFPLLTRLTIWDTNLERGCTLAANATALKQISIIGCREARHKLTTRSIITRRFHRLFQSRPELTVIQFRKCILWDQETKTSFFDTLRSFQQLHTLSLNACFPVYATLFDEIKRKVPTIKHLVITRLH